MRIVIPDDAPAVMQPSAAFRELLAGSGVTCYSDLPGTEERLLERIGDAEAIINIRSSTRFPRSVLAACPKLRILSLWGTGTDNVDLASARELGITVTNTPGVAAPAIAEHCLALMFAVARRIPTLDSQVRRGEWPRGQSVLMRGKTLGIIGLGAIGRRFAALGAAIGMRVIAWSMNSKPDAGTEEVQLDQLYRTSDVVSLHLRLSDQTIGFLGAQQFAAMKRSALFLNTARGAIVDEQALVNALITGQIAGAGLDVFAVEPLPAGHPLTTLPNVVLTPHCAGITPETTEASLRLSIENILQWSTGKPYHAVL
jgi:D-3-phosphoglycerate dehydrogenase